MGPRRDRDGPVSSALARDIPPPSTLDSISRPNMITPIPPTHWVIERHRIRLLLWLPMQSSATVKAEHTGLVEISITVAPVVVNPDIDSNQEYRRPLSPSHTEAVPENTSNGPLNIPPSQYGSAPMATTGIHPRATDANASLSLTLDEASELRAKETSD